MPVKATTFFVITLGLLLTLAGHAVSQDATSAAPAVDTAKQLEEKTELEAKAMVMLEQVISEAQVLQLPENKIRVQVIAGDLLWDRNGARARVLFSQAASMIGQLMQDGSNSDLQKRMLYSLRRELVLAAGRHDAELAYQLLRQTQPPNDAYSTKTGNRTFPMIDDSYGLEQALLTVLAKSDPKLAYQKASESLDKGEYPDSVGRILAQLQTKDPESFKKLSDKTVSRLNSENLLSNAKAADLAIRLLRLGPRVGTSATANSSSNIAPALNETSYRNLLESAVTAALTATPRATPGGNQLSQTRGEGGMIGGGPNGEFFINPPQGLDPAQVQQNNARVLLRGLSGLLAQVDRYLPERSRAVRQNLAVTRPGYNGLGDFVFQMRDAMNNGDSESLVNAAIAAPPPLQPRLYQEAARKALDEGNSDRALQIANEHLDESSRNSIMQAVDFKKLTTTVSPEKLNDIKQKLAALPSDTERVRNLAELAIATQKDNPKLALRFAEDASTLVNRRAAGYRELENQLKVASAFAAIDSKRSFEVLEPGIAQLNELLAAAQTLSGFELEVFRNGELPLQGGSELGAMVSRFGQQLASLAKRDFERAQRAAEKFQLGESRLMVKLAIIQEAFGVTPASINSDRRFENFRFLNP